MRMRLCSLTGVILAMTATALIALAAPSRPAAVELFPHRAAYRMTLAGTSRNSSIVAANGIMVYRFGRLCDGWTVENRTFLRLTYEGGVEAETKWTFVSWEAADGLSFRFRSRFDDAGRTVERIAGRASLKGKGAAGNAWLTEPEEQVIALPPGTVFPTEHMAELIAATETGKKSLARIVFDGASLENPYLVNAAFGPAGREQAEALAAKIGLPVVPTWWARLAFFPLRSRAAVPEFELGAHYRSDGIADQMTQSFDTFSLRVRMKDFEALAVPECGTAHSH